MFISRLIDEFAQYYGTQEYIRGVLIAITGIAIQIVILSIALPVILYFIRRFRSRQTRFMVDFYLFQIFHKIADIFLDMLGIASPRDLMPLLFGEMEKNSDFKIFNHYRYGNLENKLFLLKKMICDGFKSPISLASELPKKTVEDFERYHLVCENCLREIDSLTAMLISDHAISKELFKLRVLIYPLRDVIGGVVTEMKGPQNSNFYIIQLQFRLAGTMITAIDKIFIKRKTLIDSVTTHDIWKNNVKLFLTLPIHKMIPLLISHSSNVSRRWVKKIRVGLKKKQ
jgi:hypothetical protein